MHINKSKSDLGIKKELHIEEFLKENESSLHLSKMNIKKKYWSRQDLYLFCITH